MPDTQNDEYRYTIGELAEAAGVTARTIRYYTAEGLLPPPETQGKYARYRADHRNRLALIAQLKDAYLPLHEIRQQTAQLTPAQVAAMLGVAAPKRIAEASSAAEYIADVVARQRTLRVASAEPGPQLLAQPAEAAAPPLAMPMPSAPADGPRAGFFKRLIPQRRGEQAAGAAQTSEAWRRVTLAPGVELHTREPTDAATQQRIQQLLDRARDVFPADQHA